MHKEADISKELTQEPQLLDHDILGKCEIWCVLSYWLPFFYDLSTITIMIEIDLTQSVMGFHFQISFQL